MRMVISGAKFLSLYDGDRNLAKRRIWTCIRTTGKLPPKKPVQKKARKTKEEPSGTTYPESGWKAGDFNFLRGITCPLLLI